MKKALLLLPLCALPLLFLSCARENRYDDLVAKPMEKIEPQAVSGHGPRIGLALGGGGVRGFLHIGVLKALEEAGIHADILTGASAGSIIAALAASGHSAVEMEKIAEPLKPGQFADFVLSTKGLLQGKALAKWVEQQVPGDMSSTEIPLGIAVSDLTTGQSLLVRSGKVAHAVHTSCSIPGTFVPVHHEDHLWVDGAYLTTVPVRFARAMGAEVVIGVDVYCNNIPQPPADGSALNTMMLTTRRQICALGEKEFADADVLIRPEFEPENMGSFDSREAAIAAGYRAGKAKVEEITRILAEKSRAAEEETSPTP